MLVFFGGLVRIGGCGGGGGRGGGDGGGGGVGGWGGGEGGAAGWGGGAVDAGYMDAFLAAVLTRVMRAAVPIPALAAASVMHSAGRVDLSW